jgi:hypothetical protein
MNGMVFHFITLHQKSNEILLAARAIVRDFEAAQPFDGVLFFARLPKRPTGTAS